MQTSLALFNQAEKKQTGLSIFVKAKFRILSWKLQDAVFMALSNFFNKTFQA